jgi:hypothetical protein
LERLGEAKKKAMLNSIASKETFIGLQYRIQRIKMSQRHVEQHDPGHESDFRLQERLAS